MRTAQENRQELDRLLTCADQDLVAAGNVVRDMWSNEDLNVAQLHELVTKLATARIYVRRTVLDLLT